jgi:ribosomal protein L11 methylase PrmA
MCNDFVRVEAYRQALRISSKGHTVVDVGCGTGILSFAAADYGAAKVYAIENADIYKAC